MLPGDVQMQTGCFPTARGVNSGDRGGMSVAAELASKATRDQRLRYTAIARRL